MRDGKKDRRMAIREEKRDKRREKKERERGRGTSTLTGK
jgi:hypothetical protein